MKISLFALIGFCLLTPRYSNAQSTFKVLVYHETAGFRHTSIEHGIQFIQELDSIHNWLDTDNSDSSSVFTTANLEQYNVVVWLNTSGDGLLTASEQAAFENYIQNGGGFVGIHAATDTYRGGAWPWYNDLVGAIVQTSPNHTPNNTNATMDVVGVHDAVAHLGAEWNKDEEYYYWELNGGYLYSGNIDLLKVRTTGTNSYDSARAITWYKEYDGGRSFYTALGHNDDDYHVDTNFRIMIEEAILWAGKANDTVPTGFGRYATAGSIDLSVYPSPSSGLIRIESGKLSMKDPVYLKIISLEGKVVLERKLSTLKEAVDISGLEKGVYLLQVRQGAEVLSKRIVKS